MTPQSHAIRRSPRVRLPCVTPAVLRSQDGSRKRGELKIISLTGGLLSLPRPLECRAHAKLRFVTKAGAVRGAVEMLQPVSSHLQPFRFEALDQGGHRKLKATIHLYFAGNSVGEEPLDNYRRKLVHGTFFGDLFGYDPDGDDLMGVNRDPEQNCPICGVAGHNHTVVMTKECATKLLCGDDQTGKAIEPKPNSDSRISAKISKQS